MLKLELRPWWMNGILLFCAFMTFIYLPWDVFIKPLEQDQEVWFGLMFTGWAAKFGALLHWVVYGAGFWGFFKMKSWIHPWAAVYVGQIAFGMLLWSALGERSSGIIVGAVVALAFIALAIALLRSKQWFQSHPEPQEIES
ncbi:MAG: hypothetical protein ACI95C_001486 [Pseudohongiellaceae bacterium]|jgi:hypothetical protein